MKVLITGGAGFIGSNLAKKLLKLDSIEEITVLDNLSTGYIQNINPLLTNPKFKFINGDICNFKVCLNASKGIDVISHQGALGSVPRSIKDPIASNNANINGTLNIFTAAKENKVKRVVFAASSSTYGDSTNMPKVEDVIGKPLSPYAVTKYVVELYADVFAKTYGIEFIGLRYFNVFGPHQSPSGAYAAVIPLFINACIKNKSPKIFGDGTNSRDFTYIDNVLEANKKAIFTNNHEAINQIYNIAFGSSTSLIELFKFIANATKSNLQPDFLPNRLGDIPHSLANIDKAKKLLNYEPLVDVKTGIKNSVEWYKKNINFFEN